LNHQWDCKIGRGGAVIFTMLARSPEEFDTFGMLAGRLRDPSDGGCSGDEKRVNKEKSAFQKSAPIPKHAKKATEVFTI
jgi:hypothetical protein